MISLCQRQMHFRRNLEQNPNSTFGTLIYWTIATLKNDCLKKPPPLVLEKRKNTLLSHNYLWIYHCYILSLFLPLLLCRMLYLLQERPLSMVSNSVGS